MQRIQSFEFHDQAWFPAPLRDHLTDFLAFMALRFEVYRAIVPELAALCRRSGHNRLLDLCSGAGGPAMWVTQHLREAHQLEVDLVVTDRFPNQATWARHGLRGHPEPVDARDVPEALTGLRTMFASFHHFAPDDARAILQDAVRRGQPLAIVEATRRTPLWILATALSCAHMLWVSALLRPRRPMALLCTYILPIMPLVAAWDGVVSCLRTYTPGELQTMWDELDGADGWHFEARVLRAPDSPAEITLCIAAPPRGEQP